MIVSADRLEELLLSEVEKTYDVRAGVPHSIIVSSLTLENSSQLVSALIQVITRYTSSPLFSELVNVVSRVMYEAHIVEPMDRKRLSNCLIGIANPLTVSQRAMGSILNCLNSFSCFFVIEDLERFYTNRNCYPYHWLKSNIVVEDYSTLASSLADFIENGVLLETDALDQVNFLQRFIPIQKRNLVLKKISKTTKLNIRDQPTIVENADELEILDWDVSEGKMIERNGAATQH